MLRTSIAISLLLLAVGCDKSDNSEQALYRESGRPKPDVAVVPFIDHSASKLSWNLSDELSSTLCHRLSQKDKLYVVMIGKKERDLFNPFGTETGWIKDNYPDHEFVAFTEIVEHIEVPTRSERQVSAEAASAELRMTVRLRVFDMRGEEPKVVLQELIHKNHFVPKQFNQYNFDQEPWGDASFPVSPLGIAHAELTKEIASRLEDYILIATNQ
ncbi:MAG TPA: CT253 family lipoprotein [Rhabdochlamydiaceae bacterium]